MSTTLPDSLLLNGREFRYADIQQYPTNVPSDLNGYEGKVLDSVSYTHLTLPTILLV